VSRLCAAAAVLLAALPAGAAERWQVQPLPSPKGARWQVADLKFSSPAWGIAAGCLQRGSSCIASSAITRDGGRTWTVTHSTGIWGYPPHLLPLRDGPLVVVYGRRKAPFSERACVSTDGGTTWDTANELTLCDAVNTDLGYPASVQLDDGTILTVYYQDPGPDQDTCLWATRWRLVME